MFPPWGTPAALGMARSDTGSIRPCCLASSSRCQKQVGPARGCVCLSLGWGSGFVVNLCAVIKPRKNQCSINYSIWNPIRMNSYGWCAQWGQRALWSCKRQVILTLKSQISGCGREDDSDHQLSSWHHIWVSPSMWWQQTTTPHT